MFASLLESLRLALSRWLLSPLQGILLGDWWRLLAANRFAIAPRYWPRAALTTVSSVGNSLQARRENRSFGDVWRAVVVREPVFVLGHYRSGTTLLHHLLAADARFATVNSYQATFPNTFLRNEATLARMGGALAIRRRPQDNLDFDPRHPAEDELALCTDTQLSPHLAWHFPRRAEFYNRRYLTFDDASPDERQRWIASLRRLAAMLTLKHGRRLLFKSPLHTARVALLLEAFPDAHFVHVHRDPYRVYQSTHHMELAVEPFYRYQRSHPESLDDRILWRYRVMYEVYLRDRVSIPAGRLSEIRFDALEAAPMETLGTIYRDLRLPDIDAARPSLKRHLESVRGHRKNVYGQLDPETAARLRQHWGFAFEAFDYESRSDSAAR